MLREQNEQHAITLRAQALCEAGIVNLGGSESESALGKRSLTRGEQSDEADKDDAGNQPQQITSAKTDDPRA